MPHVTLVDPIAAHAEGGGGMDAARVVAAIQDDIVFGRLKPRERLTEEALCQRFGVNRNTIRRALSDLHRLGLVAHEAFRGAKVRDYELAEIRDIVDMRGVLLRHGLESMAWPVATEAIEALAAIQAAHAAAVAARDLRAIHAHNAAFHGDLHALFVNRRLAETLDHLGWLLMVIRAYRSLRLDSMTKAVGEHDHMVAALRRRDRADFVAAVLHHVRTPEDIFGEIQAWTSADPAVGRRADGSEGSFAGPGS